MYFYVVSNFEYKLHRHFALDLTLERWANILMLHANEHGYREFRRDSSLIGGYWVNPNLDAMVASPVALDKDGNVM